MIQRKKNETQRGSKDQKTSEYEVKDEWKTNPQKKTAAWFIKKEVPCKETGINFINKTGKKLSRKLYHIK
ncbi:MAG: hypothetical protein LIP12_02435 [Clostridiales bacterium]|nr:hypothetical protein [Clostridiales bacterium]